MRKLVLLLLLLGLIATACNPFVTTTPRPSPQPIRVAYPPVLRTWEEKLHHCAGQHPEIALIVQEVSSPKPEDVDLTLWFGEPSNGIPGYAASLGRDQIVIVAGSSVQLEQITAEELGAIYAQPESNYQIWTYAQGNPLRAIFNETVLGELQLSPDVRLVPHPAAMLEAIRQQPSGLGYVPQSWLTETTHIVPSNSDLQIAFEQPILVLGESEPQGSLRSYLNCLQIEEEP